MTNNENALLLCIVAFLLVVGYGEYIIRRMKALNAKIKANLDEYKNEVRLFEEKYGEEDND